MRGVGVHITEEAVVSGWTVDAAELWWFRSCSPKCGLSQQMGMMGLDQCREDPFLPYTCFPLSSPPTLLPGQDCDCALQDTVRSCDAAALVASSPAPPSLFHPPLPKNPLIRPGWRSRSPGQCAGLCRRRPRRFVTRPWPSPGVVPPAPPAAWGHSWPAGAAGVGRGEGEWWIGV